jgi:hypothetical protein
VNMPGQTISRKKNNNNNNFVVIKEFRFCIFWRWIHFDSSSVAE